MSKNLSPSKRFLAARLDGQEATNERKKMIALSQEIPDVINLGRGDPDLETPAHIVEAAIKSLKEGGDSTHYTPWAGLLELRKAIADKLKNENHIIVDPASEIIVTVGAQEAIFLTMMALLNPGDEIIVPEPRYTPYDTSISLAGGVMVPVETTIDHDFEVRAADIEKVITKKTKAILLVSPNNPTGAVISKKNLEEIAALAEREDLLIISDELYEKLMFNNEPAYSIASFPRMFERTITVNGLSKSYSMTGWRIGYLAGPKDLIQPMLNLKYAVTICAAGVTQKAAIAALTGPQDCINETVSIYQERLKVVMAGLDRLGIPYVAPKGSFYIFPDIRKFRMSSYDFANTLLKSTGVFTFPGTCFGKSGEGFIRLSLLVPVEQIKEAFDRTEKFLLKQKMV